MSTKLSCDLLSTIHLIYGESLGHFSPLDGIEEVKLRTEDKQVNVESGFTLQFLPLHRQLKEVTLVVGRGRGGGVKCTCGDKMLLTLQPREFCNRIQLLFASEHQ